MKPIATVHWTVDDKEHSKDVHLQTELNMLTALLSSKDYPYIVCMLTLTDNIHFKPQKRPYRHIS